MWTSGIRRMLPAALVVLLVAVLGATEGGDDKKKDWPRPRTDERRKDRERMVRNQIARRNIKDEKVLDAMRSVPRHWFVPERLQRLAYDDRPLPIGKGQTISQPYIVALMTELLELDEDDKVLEVGTGSGYQAAVLNELTPHVFSIEIIRELGKAAAERMKERGYTKTRTKTGDGYYGWKGHSPFDAIIVTAAGTHIPPPLLKQLKPGGRMVIPVGAPFRVQRLMLLKKDDEGKATSKVVTAVRFVPLTGGHEKKED